MDIKQFIRSGKNASDITPLLLDPHAFSFVIDTFALKFQKCKIDKIVCIESRGFLFGAALAYKLQVGMVLLRKEGKLQQEVFSVEFTDYTGSKKTLEMHKDAIQKGESVVIIDDWLETGGVIKAAIELVTRVQGLVVGIGVVMDDSSLKTKDFLAKYNYQYIEQVLPTDTF